MTNFGEWDVNNISLIIAVLGLMIYAAHIFFNKKARAFRRSLQRARAVRVLREYELEVTLKPRNEL